MNKRKFTALTVAALMALTALSAMPALGAEQKITVKVDGKEVVFDQEPVNINSRVMVPVRFVAEAMGWEVSYETVVNGGKTEHYAAMTKYVQADKSDSPFYRTDIMLDRGSLISGCGYENTYEIDNRPLVAGTVILNGRTLVGVRDIAEGLHADVKWIGETKTVEVTTKAVEEFPNFHMLIAEKPEIYTPIEPINGKAFDMPDKTDDVLALANKERKAAGSEDIYIGMELSEAANLRAKEIITQFSHSRPNGSDCWSAVEEVYPGYSAGKTLGEIIQMASYDLTADQVIQNWMNSPGHRENLLKKEFKYTGIGHAEEKGSHYWVMMFSD